MRKAGFCRLLFRANGGVVKQDGTLDAKNRAVGWCDNPGRCHECPIFAQQHKPVDWVCPKCQGQENHLGYYGFGACTVCGEYAPLLVAVKERPG